MIAKIVLNSGSTYAFENVSEVNKQKEKLTLIFENGKQIDINSFEIYKYSVWLNNGKKIIDY